MLKTFTAITVCGWFILYVFPGLCLSQEVRGDEPAIFQLGQVLVTGSRDTINQANAVTEISEKEIRDWGVRTAGEALDYVPGIDVHTGGQGQSFVNIRGFAPKEVKVLIDGVPAKETYLGALDLSQIPVDSIARIVVVRGASSVLYGANTLGGIINIITKKGGVVPVTEFSASFGDYDTQGYTFNRGAEAGNFNYWLTASYQKSDGFRLSENFDRDSEYLGENSSYHEDGGKRDLSNYQKRNLNLKVGYEPDDDTKIYLSFDYHNNERGCPPEYDHYWAFTEWNQWHLNLVAQKSFNELFTVKARVFYVDHEDTLSDVSWNGHQTLKKRFEEQRYNDYSAGGEIHGCLDLGKFSLLRMGLNYIKDNHKEQEYLDGNCISVKKGLNQPGWQPEKEFETDTYTLALEDEIRPIEELSFVFGLSHDYFVPLNADDRPVPDKTGSWNPQATMVYRFTGDTILRASLGKKTRFPHLKELYSKYTGGNPDLGPEKAVSYELGIEKDFPSGKIWASYFYNNVRDMIQRVGGNGDWIYDNIGRAVLQGVETGLEIQPARGIRLRCDYTFLSARDKTLDQDISRRPRHRANLEVRLPLPLKTSIDLLASYTASQVEYLDDGSSHRLDDFLLINLGIKKAISLSPSMREEFFVNISNITDIDYNDGHGPMPGCNFMAGMRIRI